MQDGGALANDGRVKRGDKLVRVDGFDCMGVPRDVIKSRVFGPPHSEVVLEFQRGQRMFTVILVRTPGFAALGTARRESRPSCCRPMCAIAHIGRVRRRTETEGRVWKGGHMPERAHGVRLRNFFGGPCLTTSEEMEGRRGVGDEAETREDELSAPCVDRMLKMRSGTGSGTGTRTGSGRESASGRGRRAGKGRGRGNGGGKRRGERERNQESGGVRGGDSDGYRRDDKGQKDGGRRDARVRHGDRCYADSRGTEKSPDFLLK